MFFVVWVTGEGNMNLKTTNRFLALEAGDFDPLGATISIGLILGMYFDANVPRKKRWHGNVDAMSVACLLSCQWKPISRLTMMS